MQRFHFHRPRFHRPLAASLVLLLHCLSTARASPEGVEPHILTVGSLNVDIIIGVDRLPVAGETLMARTPSATVAVGGKGANQAVAAARLSAGTGRASRFVTQFGNDSYAAMMEAALRVEGVDVSGCGRVGMTSGQGIVMLEPDGGATSLVVPGANTAFPELSPTAAAALVAGAGAVLLQREVPQHVNAAVAAAARAAGIPVLLDAGGEDTPIPDALLALCDFFCPNESELARLTGLPVDSDAQVAAAAAALQARGARAVLATLGPRGALLALPDGALLRQAALQPAAAQPVDATAAGDAFRAAFAVALVEGRPLQDCLRFASAAGGLAVTRMGAVPSLPHRAETEQLAASGGGEEGGLSGMDSGSGSGPADSAAAIAAAAAAVAPQGSGTARELSAGSGAAGRGAAPPQECPLRFASRLNSMSARRDLAGPADGPDSVLGWIRRQARVPGLSLVAFNHPQHTAGHTAEELRGALAAAGLGAAAVALRFPEAEFGRGAFTHPNPGVRRRALQLAVEGCGWAAALGAPDLVVWPQHDGYNYHLEMDYAAAWERAVQAYRSLADACPPGVRVSLEWKGTDEAARWSLVPSTGAALLLVAQVGRPNFGLTLDAGHMLLAGENPAQSAALAGNSLFGLHLNDAAVRLGAEDGLALASVGGAAALELVRWLQRLNYTGTVYFDTFPRREDPVREAAHNIRRFSQLWARAARLAPALDAAAEAQDAMAALELLLEDDQRCEGAGPPLAEGAAPPPAEGAGTPPAERATPPLATAACPAPHA